MNPNEGLILGWTLDKVSILIENLNQNRNKLICTPSNGGEPIKMITRTQKPKPNCWLEEKDNIGYIMDFLGPTWIQNNFTMKQIHSGHFRFKREEIIEFLEILQETVNKKIQLFWPGADIKACWI